MNRADQSARCQFGPHLRGGSNRNLQAGNWQPGSPMFFDATHLDPIIGAPALERAIGKAIAVRLGLLFLGGVAVLATALLSWGKRKRKAAAAYGRGQPSGEHLGVRDAGPAAMRDEPTREWTEVDEELDQSFPTSDPPGRH